MTTPLLDERATRVLRGALGPLKSRFGDAAVAQLIDLAVVVASADGQIDEEERVALSATVAVVLGETIDAAALATLVDARIEAIEREGLDARATSLGLALHEKNAADEGLVAAIAIAQCSGEIGEEERRVLELIAAAADATDDLDPLIHQISAAVAKDT